MEPIKQQILCPSSQSAKDLGRTWQIALQLTGYLLQFRLSTCHDLRYHPGQVELKTIAAAFVLGVEDSCADVGLLPKEHLRECHKLQVDIPTWYLLCRTPITLEMIGGKPVW